MANKQLTDLVAQLNKINNTEGRSTEVGAYVLDNLKNGSRRLYSLEIVSNPTGGTFTLVSGMCSHEMKAYLMGIMQGWASATAAICEKLKTSLANE